jgi:peptide/nickel transport system ATP-binding protein
VPGRIYELRPGRIASGQILLEGSRIDNLPPDALRRLRGRRIGAIFQDPLTSLNPLYTIGRQLTETILAHLPLSRGAARDRAIALLAEVGIAAPEQRLGHYPHQFSGGMRQRIAIAIALACGPRLLIADEPTTALDVTVQAGILRLLDRLRRERDLSVVLITHDLAVMSSIADRISILYAGRVVESGPREDLLKHPRHPYTAALLAALRRSLDNGELDLKRVRYTAIRTSLSN